MTREIVVISGKGGTGKTSLTASFATLARQPVIADCDVDAADLHLVLAPRVIERHEFWSGHEAVIRPTECTACGACLEDCRFGAIKTDRQANGQITFSIDPMSCEGCGVCVRFCPVQAIEFRQRRCGEWMVSDTRCGPMVHAQLGIAAENSGKLVSTVRRAARRVADESARTMVIVDGPPGIGCPVIASIAGADGVLVVTEPTRSGEHDLRRVLELARHFRIPSWVCVNKSDINPELTARIEEEARRLGSEVAGRIPWDPSVTGAQLAGASVVEYEDGPASNSIRTIWERLENAIL
ncbi:MAG: 4Fe-4S dicluster domain-containing protein [Acidobacteriota bacterium]